MEPEASVKRERVSEVSHWRQEKSYNIPLVNEQAPHFNIFIKTRCKLDVVMGFLTPLVRLIILCKKVRPTDQQLKLLQGCRSLGSKLAEGGFNPLNLVLWQPGFHCMWIENNSHELNNFAGTPVLAAEMGMLRFLNDKIMLDILTWQKELKGAVGAGGSIIRKSSKMWHTKEIAQLFCNIHSYPLNCVRKLIVIKWGRTEPKGEHFIKMVRPTPKHAQKFPIMGMNGKEPKCWFYVGLAMKQSEPNLWIGEIALSIVMYWREKIILVDKMVYTGGPCFGEGQMKLLSECFLGTRPIAETGLREALGKFLEKRNCLGPEKPILAPSLSSKHSLLTNILSGLLWRAHCRLKTFTGVITLRKLLATVAGAMVLTVGLPSPWRWLLFWFRGKRAPDPGVIPHNLACCTCVHRGRESWHMRNPCESCGK